MMRPTDPRPWRVVSHATWQSTHSILQSWRTGHRWALRLHPCGHTVYRRVRYNPTAHGLQPGMDDALLPPKRVRCDQCARQPAQEA
jgi:hypothetical protein